jgi:hypothetical protein
VEGATPASRASAPAERGTPSSSASSIAARAGSAIALAVVATSTSMTAMLRGRRFDVRRKMAA